MIKASKINFLTTKYRFLTESANWGIFLFSLKAPWAVATAATMRTTVRQRGEGVKKNLWRRKVEGGGTGNCYRPLF